MKYIITTIVFVWSICFLTVSCVKNNGKELCVAFFIYTTESKFSNYYIEVLCDKSIIAAKGLETELVSQIMFNGEEARPGKDRYISDETFHPDTIYDENHHAIEWNTYLGAERKEGHLSDEQFKLLGECVIKISKMEEGNMFPKIYNMGEWKSNDAGVIMMYKDKVYSFWLDSEYKTEKTMKKYEDICPIKIEIPKRDNPYN